MTQRSLTETPLRKVGDPVWIFNQNRRVYVKHQSGPIWREHWEKKSVLGETSRSWLVGREYEQIKIPKKGPQPWGVCWSEEEVTRRAYVNDNAYKISDLVRRIDDCDTLKKVADLVGYQT